MIDRMVYIAAFFWSGGKRSLLLTLFSLAALGGCSRDTTRADFVFINSAEVETLDPATIDRTRALREIAAGHFAAV